MSKEQLQPIRDMLLAQAANRATEIGAMREEFNMMAATFVKEPDIKREEVDVDGMRGAWFTAPDSSSNRIVLYLHGGAYILGSIDTHESLIGRIAKAAKARCLAVDYRLAPEHPHPAAVEDATKAYQWLLKQGIDSKRIAISGDSAGGGLTLATLLKTRDDGKPLPACAACLSPWVDLEATGNSMESRAEADPMIEREGVKAYGKVFLGGKNPHDPLAAPLYGDYTGLPPLLIQVGGDETLLDDSTRVADKAAAAGVEVDLQIWDDMIHVWQVFAPYVDESGAAIETIGAFVQRNIA